MNTSNFEDILKMTEAVKAMIETHASVAEGVHSYYKALIDAGFTEIQAFELVKAHGFYAPLPSAGGSDNA
jgi:hypothetical protein